MQRTMRRRNNLFVGILLLLFFTDLKANDSLKLSFNDYMGMVVRFHPVARQATLLNDQSRYNLMMARGNFDPTLGADFSNKFYSGTQYYALLNTLATVPIWFGPEIKMGFDQSQGAYVNAMDQMPASGLLYAGIKVPLAQGLLIDHRRAAVMQARIFERANEQQQQLILNELFYEASRCYYDWMLYDQNVLVYRNGVDLARQRLNFVRSLHAVGERPGVDTLEAFIQLQSRQMLLNEAELVSKNQKLVLSVFLWGEDMRPMDLRDDVHPDRIDLSLIKSVSPAEDQRGMDTLSTSHPAMLLYNYKLQDLEIERRYKTDKLKPKLSAQYNFLGYPVSGNDFSTENYKWGLQFSFPVFLRQERGAIGLTKVKIQQAQLDRDLKSMELQVKWRSAYNELLFLREQMQMAESNLVNYRRLLDAERMKFVQGESSLFMIIAREVMVIETEVKFNEIRAKYFKSYAAYRFASGFANRMNP
ncbi:MAG TPA: TolC family protein [Flavobacteriales bacterium]|nr:TolC family protein [Flavobacteriales bacterium]